MKCPYCNKSRRDIPDHLRLTKACSTEHGKNLLGQFRAAAAAHNKRMKEFQGEIEDYQEGN